MKTILCEKDETSDEAMKEVRMLRLTRHPCIIDVVDVYYTIPPRYHDDDGGHRDMMIIISDILNC